MNKENLTILATRVVLVAIVLAMAFLLIYSWDNKGGLTNGTYERKMGSSLTYTLSVKGNTIVISNGIGAKKWTYKVQGDEIILMDDEGNERSSSFEKLDNRTIIIDDMAYIRK